jgi:hypothetical protein
MTPDFFAINMRDLTNLQSVHLSIWPYSSLERSFPVTFPSWLVAFTSVSILFVVFNIGKDPQKNMLDWFEENFALINAEVGTDAVRSVVLGDDLRIYGTYYNMVLR